GEGYQTADVDLLRPRFSAPFGSRMARYQMVTARPASLLVQAQYSASSRSRALRTVNSLGASARSRRIETSGSETRRSASEKCRGRARLQPTRLNPFAITFRV